MSSQSDTANEEYEKLQAFLSQGKWLDADITTRVILCILTKREREFILVPEAVNLLGCDDLGKICSLWERHSGGQYGFPVQARIWSEVGGIACVRRYEDMSRGEREALGRIEILYAKRVGIPTWGSKSSDPTRIGHFPYTTHMCSYGYGLIGMVLAAFARRLVDCGLIDDDALSSDSK